MVQSRPESEIRELFAEAVQAMRVGDQELVERMLGALESRGTETVAHEISAFLESLVASRWALGWQPVDLARAVDRALGRAESVLIRVVIAAQAESYASLGEKVAPDWMDQLRRIGADRPRGGRAGSMVDLGPDWPATLRAAIRTTIALTHLPPLTRLGDPPGEWREGLTVGSGSLPAGILDKVRALLAKAESTTFDAEAEAFTAKAQELMARHRIDRAVVSMSAEPGAGEEAVGRRIWIDGPYLNAKAVLLFRVADANGCSAVWSSGLGFMTVFGFGSELDAVDELFTSLLVQATGALRREGSRRDRLGRNRTKSFRRSFLIAFRGRIGQRLREAVDAVVESVSRETGTELVPILAGRADEIAAVADAAFPRTSRFSANATDPEGWHAGTEFANQADLSVAPTLTRRTA